MYWDLQVLDTNNYVTTDGSINHNSGKSVACCFEIFIRACEQVPNKNGIRKSRWLVVRNTLPQLETTTMKTWVDWFPPGDPTKGYFGKMTGKPPYTHKILYMLGDDTTVDLEVQFLALDKPEDVKKLLSYECSGVWFNEAREIPKELLDAATGRVGRYPSAKDGGCTRRTIILDTNPPDDSHWWYHLAEEDTPDNWEFFEQPSGLSHEAENLENLVQPANFEELSLAERREHGKEYYKQMIGGKTEEWIKVYVKGQYGFIKEGQPVYKGSWNDNIHVAKSPILWSPNSVITVGVDSSGRHPAAVFLQRNSRGQVQVLGELCILDEEGMGASNYAPLLKSRVSELFPGNTLEFWGDPAGGFKTQNDEQTYFDILKANGIFIKASPGFRLPQRIETVISILSRMVDGEPALLVSPACKHLIKGFNGGYQYKRISTSGDATYSEKPHKNRFSDVQDALQYGLCGMGEMRQMLGRNKGRQKAHTVSKKWSVFGRKGR